MNYKSQLKGWAIDRIIEYIKAVSINDKRTNYSLEGLMSDANELAAYAYIAREDLESTAKDLFDLVRNAPANESSVDAMIGTLEHIKQDRLSQGIDTDETAVKETVQ